METITYMQFDPVRPYYEAKTHFSIFLHILFEGGGTILLNSVILKENFDGNIGKNKK